MAFPQGIDFRNTSGFVTDPTNCDPEIGIAVNYPRTTAQGNTVGWETINLGITTRDRTAANDARLAGLHFGNNNNGTPNAVYRIDLPATGTYSINLALGDQTFLQPGQSCEFFDTTTSISVVALNVVSAVGSYIDATGTQYSTANWPGSNTALSATFATTIFRIDMGKGTSGSNWAIAHVFIAAAAAASVPVVNPDVSFPYRDTYPQSLRTSAFSRVPFANFDPPLAGMSSYDLPQVASQFNRGHAFSRGNFSGFDPKLIGQAIFDIPPPGPYQPIRGWTVWRPIVANFDPLLIGKVLYELPKIAFQFNRGWTYNPGVRFTGFDPIPPGKAAYELPRQPFRPNFTYISVAFIQPLSTPFFQTDWPLPRVADYPGNLRTVTVSGVRFPGFDPPLIGQSSTELPRLPNRPDFTFTLSQFIPANLPFFQTDWPLPRVADYPSSLRSATVSRGQFLGFDPPLAGSAAADLPKRAPWFDVSWLNGQFVQLPQTPFVQTDWPLPRGAEYPGSLRTNQQQPFFITSPPPLPGKMEYALQRGAEYPLNIRTQAITSQFLTPLVVNTIDEFNLRMRRRH